MAEGIKGRNRESQVPRCSAPGHFPYSGSDPRALNIALDKALAKEDVVRQHGILTPNFLHHEHREGAAAQGPAFPLIVKPIAEGSSKGVHATSVVEERGRAAGGGAHKMIAKYDQPALVEDYIRRGASSPSACWASARPKVLR